MNNSFCSDVIKTMGRYEDVWRSYTIKPGNTVEWVSKKLRLFKASKIDELEKQLMEERENED